MTGAPLPLLGTFHELSVAVSDVRAAVEFYERLGFTQATTGDIRPQPYGVLTDGTVFIGLHQRGGPSPVLSFVRGGVAAGAAALEAAGIALTVRHTGDEEFNEIGFNDPDGQAVAVLEARTYSPADRDANELSLCGEFAEVSLPAADFAAAQAFWEPLGFVAAEAADEPYPHLTLTSDHLDLALHRRPFSTVPLLVFRAPDPPARLAALRAAGVDFAPAPRALASSAALIEAPGGIALLLLEGV